MKPDGVTMETTEPTEAAAVAEALNPAENSSEQASHPSEQQPTAAGPPKAAATVNGASTGPSTKPKSAIASTKRQPLSKTESAPGLRPGVTSRQRVIDGRPTNSVGHRNVPLKNPSSPSTKPPGAATVPKKPLGGASVGTSATRIQLKTTSGPAAAVSNGTKPGTNGTPKKSLAATKPKTTAPPGRPTGPTAPKPGTSISAKSSSAAPMKTSRPATAPTSRPAAKPSTAAATAKPPFAAKAASRAATAPSSGRTQVAHANKPTAPAKKDISQPPAAAVTKKTSTSSTAIKKTEVSKSISNVKSSTSSAKVEPKPHQSIKPNASKKPAAVAARFPAVSKVQTPPCSPAPKSSSSASMAKAKQAHKPTQAAPRFTAAKRPEKGGAPKAVAVASNNADAPSEGKVSAAVALVAAAAVVPEIHVAAVAPLQQECTEPVKEFDAASIEMTQKEPESKVSSQSPVTSGSTQIEQHQPNVPAPLNDSPSAESQVSPGALSLQPKVLVADTQRSEMPQYTTVAENGSSEETPSININEDEEEEEKEGSQLVSVSEMSGTTQPTEESRPGSAGPVGAAWRVGGALLSELDSEEVSVSQQGASELSAPGVLEGTESMDDLGESSLKGAMDMEGASAGSPDFEKVPEIPVNDYEDDEDDDNNCVCDMDVGSERTDEPQRIRHDNDVDDEEDEDVEMASEGVTESGLESYGNADEDDFAEDERLDNLNRVAQPPPPPPLLPSAPAAQWDQPNPFADPWAEVVPQQQPSEPDYQMVQGAGPAPDSPLTDPCQGDSETPTQEPTQTWLELGSVTYANENQEFSQSSSGKTNEHISEPQIFPEDPKASADSAEPRDLSCAPRTSPLNMVSKEASTPEKIPFVQSEEEVLVPKPEIAHGAEPVCAPVDEGTPASNPSSSSVTEDEASDMEGEAQLEDSLENTPICNVTMDIEPQGKRCLSTVEESEEPEDSGAAEDATPPSATSQVSYGFDNTISMSNSNAQSTGENCVKSPGIFSLEELPEEPKEPQAQPSVVEQPYIQCGEEDADCEQAANASNAKTVDSDKVCSPSPEPQQLEPMNQFDDTQPPYYSAICEKTENSFAGFSALLHPQRRDHSSYPRTYCDIVKPVNAALASPKLSCADLPPRSPKQQPLSPQLRRLEQHQRHLQELQQRREQQSRPLEEAEQERKRREEEEERKKKDEAEEEIKRNKEEQEKRLQEEEAKRQEVEQRKALELQLHQQQEELKQRQQIMQWQQELQESNKGQPLQLSPSGLCTIYEALEHSDNEDDGVAKCEVGSVKELNSVTEMSSETGLETDSDCVKATPESQSTCNSQDLQRVTASTQNGDSSSTPPDSPDKLSPLDLDWGKKADIVHQLINQTLLLNGDGCSSLLLLPGGAGGTLSPLESSLWPSLLPPLTPPSATVTSVSSFSPETSGSSPQGEWTVVELETHH